MKHFLEMKQTLTGEEIREATLPFFIRIGVTGKGDAISKKAQLAHLFAGKPRKDFHHVCHHPDNHPPCEREEI